MADGGRCERCGARPLGRTIPQRLPDDVDLLGKVPAALRATGPPGAP